MRGKRQGDKRQENSGEATSVETLSAMISVA